MDKPKIFVYRPTKDYVDCAGVAFAEDGKQLAFHVSSGHSWFQVDMGLREDTGIGKEKHARYQEHYPDGYELVEVIGKANLQQYIDCGALRGVSFDRPPG